MAASPDRKELKAQWKTEVEVPSMKAEDVAKHNVKGDNWIIIHGKVYDVTNYARDHPGGAEALYEVAGTDATSAYEDVGHSEDAREIMSPFLVGVAVDVHNTTTTTQKSPEVHVVRRGASEKPAKSSQLTTQVEIAGFAICSAILVWFVRTTHLLPHPSTLHLSQGGFAMGFLCAGGASATLALLGYHQWSKAMAFGGSYTRFPAHIHMSNDVVKPNHPAGVLKPQDYQKFPLIRKDLLSKDTVRLVFKLPSPVSILGLPIGQHVAIRGYFDDDSGHHTVTRSYTPVSNNKDLGRLELVIKIYPDGQLTGKYLSKLEIGDEVEFRGPKGQMKYRKGLCKNLGMVAGGTGITPMFQLVRSICEDKTDRTQVHLLYSSKTPEDILLRTQLERYQKMAPEKFHLHMSVDKPQPGWTGGVGFIDKKLMQDKFAGPHEDTKILLCGPPGMVNASKKSLLELGYEAPGAVTKLSDQVFCF